MPATLPRNIQHKLEQTLAQWPQWLCTPLLTSAPEVLAILAPGVSNYSVLVESGEQFVVRIDGINPATNGLNRQTEWRALLAAHNAGLAPRPRYFNPDLGSLVCDYLSPDKQQPLCIQDVAALLRDIHQLPTRHNRLDLAERILRYEKQLEHRGQQLSAGMRQCRIQVLDMLERTRQGAGTPVLCHNDLLRANRIYSAEKLWAIDWEYCAMGSLWYDIAVVINGDSLNAAQTDELLRAYLSRPPQDQERLELYRYSCIYRYLELLWYLALERSAAGPDALAQKVAELEALLLQA